MTGRYSGLPLRDWRTVYCTHEYCRITTIAELLWLAETSPNRTLELLDAAIKAYHSEVPCRKVTVMLDR